MAFTENKNENKYNVELISESEESKDAHLKKFMLVKDKIIAEISEIRERLGESTIKEFGYTKTGEKITPLPIGKF